MPKYVPEIAGVALTAAGLLLEPFSGGLSSYLVMAVIGMVTSGIRTLLGGNLATRSTGARDPIAPWNVVYGRSRVGGILIYFGEFVYTPTPWYDVLLGITFPIIGILELVAPTQN